MQEENWLSIALKVISYVLTFLGGGLTFTVFVVKNYRKKQDSNRTYQKDNVVGGDMAGRDIRK